MIRFARRAVVSTGAVSSSSFVSEEIEAAAEASVSVLL
jgi:hypothetical protein